MGHAAHPHKAPPVGVPAGERHGETGESASQSFSASLPKLRYDLCQSASVQSR